MIIRTDKIYPVAVSYIDASGNTIERGYETLAAAWSAACFESRRFTVKLNRDLKAPVMSGLFFTEPVRSAKTITVDLNGHTIDNSANPLLTAFTLSSDHISFTLKNGFIKGGCRAICVAGGSNTAVTLENVIIQGASRSAVLFKGAKSKNMVLTMNRTLIENTKNGSAVRIQPADTTLIIDACRFERNNGASGGAVCSHSQKTVIVTDSVFSENSATKGFGGAIDTTDVHLSGCTFMRNCADKWDFGNAKGAGGAVCADNIKCENSVFSDNLASDRAGAILVRENSCNIIRIVGSTFIHNHAPNAGGAICVSDLVFDGKNHEISNCVFNNNQALSGCSLFVERSWNTRTHLLGDWNNSGVKSRKTIDGSNDEAWGLYCYIKYNCA